MRLVMVSRVIQRRKRQRLRLFASLVQEPLPSLPNDLPSWEVIQSEAPGRCADLLSIVESQSISEGRI